MTPEEIKKIAEEYGKGVTDNVSYNAYSDPNKRREIAAKSGAYQARMVLEWLSKDYAIIPKNKVKERYEESKLRSKSELKFDIITGNSRVSLLESLFNVDDL